MSDAPIPSADRSVAWCVAVALLVWLAVSLYGLLGPVWPLGVHADPAVFSAGRAMAVVEEIAQRPHPIGSVENTRVRDALVARLSAMGLEPVVETRPLVAKKRINMVQSIYARIPGTASTGAIMLTGHYDSTAYGPGAADDCSGVAVCVETARALLAGPPLKNDIIIHLSDGEEGGLLGPRTFLEQGPWRETLAMVANFEARGHYGPSMMFQTSPGNGWLIEQYLAAAPYPVASSMMFDLAKTMPTTTDYWVYKQAGVPGLDFAFVGGLPYYHTMNDTPDHLSRATVQQHGSNAMAVAQHFGNLDLAPLKTPQPDAVYFNVLGPIMARYPGRWIVPIAGLAMALTALAIGVGFVRRRVTIRGLMGGIGLFVLALVLASFAVAVPWFVGFYRFGPYVLYNQLWFVAGALLMTTAVVFFCYGILGGRVRMENLAAGALLVLCGVLGAMTAVLPFGSYLYAWPIIGSSVSLLLLLFLPEEKARWVRIVVMIGGALAPIAMVAPQLLMTFESFSLVFAPLLVMLWVAMGGLMVPAVAVMARSGRWRAVALLVMLSLPCLGYAVGNTEMSPDRPLMNDLSYGANFDTGEAVWASRSQGLDDWLAGYFTNPAQEGTLDEFLPGDGELYLKNGAPMLASSEASVSLVEDFREGNRRVVRIRVQPAHETAGFSLFVPPGVPVTAAYAYDKPVGDPLMPLASWVVEYKGRCDEGLVLDLDVAPDFPGEVAVTLIERHYGMPALSADVMPPRPDWMIPMTNTMPTWDFSAENLRTLNPFKVLHFDAGAKGNRCYTRQTFVVAASGG